MPNRNLIRDIIVPRFLKTLLLEYYLSVERRDDVGIEQTSACIAALLPHLAPRTRFMLSPFASSTPRLFHLAIHAMRYAPPVRALGRLVVQRYTLGTAQEVDAR
jgi:hypothetical protein